MESPIEFLTEDIDFDVDYPDMISLWVSMIADRYGYKLHSLSVVFCSDAYLLELNKTHLNHDYFTDIITFPYHAEGSHELVADLFISVDRVRENARELKGNFIDELHRVIIHGVLHLVGFDDKEPAKKTKMRRAEDLALSLRMF